MKICITSQGDKLDSQVDPRFGRAAKFIMYETETKEFTVVDNKQNLQAAQGAGIQAGQNVASSGAKAVITGHCGPKAFQTLFAAGMEVYTGAEGTVAEAIQAWTDNKLQKASKADVVGHW